MNKNGLWTILKKQLMIGQAKDGEKPKLTKYHYFLFVFVLGVSFMLVSQLFSSPEKTEKDQTAQTVMSGRTEDKSGQKSAPVFKASKDGSAKTTIDDYERDYENQLKEILETIIGVEDVSIVVNVDATSLKVFEKNKTEKDTTTEETDKEGGKRSVTDQTSEEQIVMIRNGDQETPVVVQTKKPDIRGVLVVAQGVDNVQIKKTIIDAVTRVLDVPSYRVAVAPKKIKEDS
ncbi:stage III sporulation protein AG [Bacillus velezensis]|uniref:stage III sporulation protein AG n=1 Tax=Bacillus velezensis TaxID=492670 RepID=UPI000D3487DF|nr:stage III sporulation protein AG [Bacillus velezensis]